MQRHCIGWVWSEDRRWMKRCLETFPRFFFPLHGLWLSNAKKSRAFNRNEAAPAASGWSRVPAETSISLSRAGLLSRPKRSQQSSRHLTNQPWKNLEWVGGGVSRGGAKPSVKKRSLLNAPPSFQIVPCTLLCQITYIQTHLVIYPRSLLYFNVHICLKRNSFQELIFLLFFSSFTIVFKNSWE